jgi:hypothetical protein
MYFDPPERFKLMEKPPELSRTEIAAEEERFISAVNRELIILGESSKTISALLGEMRDRLVVTPRFGDHETRYSSRYGGLLNAKQAAEAIVKEAGDRDSLLAFGPERKALTVAS